MDNRNRDTRPRIATATAPPASMEALARGRNGGGGNGGDVSRTRMRGASSPLVQRQHFANRHDGLSFDTSITSATAGWGRDLYFTLGYKKALTLKDYRARYQRGGIANRLVEAQPRATWSGGALVVEDPAPDVTTPFEEALDELFARLDVWARLLRADILAGLGRYSVVVIGAGGEFNTPLPANLNGPDGVLYLRALAEDRAAIEERNLVQDKADPRFGEPEFYTLNLGTGTASTVKTHYTRIVHLAESCLDNDIYGRPRLEAVWNYLDDLDKLVGGGAEAAWKRADPGMQLDLNPDLEYDAGVEAALEEEIDDYQHNVRRTIRTRGVDLKLLQSAVANFGPNTDAVIALVSATSGIPHRILTGSERGELASTQDRNNWNDRITERRREFAVPLTSQLVDRLIAHGALPAPVDPYVIVWPETDKLDETDKAEVAATIAEANQKQAAAGGGLVMTGDEIRNNVYGLDPLVDEGESVGGDGDTDSDTTGLAALAETFDNVDTPADEPEWRSVHRAADAHEGSFARATVGMWRDAQALIDTGELESALATVNTVSLTVALNVDDEDERTEAVENVVAAPLAVVTAALAASTAAFAETLPERIHTVLADGGQAALRSARARGSYFRAAATATATLTRYMRTLRRRFRSATFTATFDATNPRAVEWAAARSSELITEITPDTRAAVRAMIADGLSTGIPPRKLARQIVGRVGLRTDQARAVSNLAARLNAAQPGELVMAGQTRIRVPDTGVTEALVGQRSDEYATRLLNQRGVLISRTETMRAANQGQRELWLQGVDDGQLDTGVEREWIVTPDSRLREDHAAMEGVTVGITESFVVPDGTSEPGEAPNCRCAQGLVRAAA